MSTHTKIMSIEEIENLRNSLKEATLCKTPPYAIYRIKTSDCTITAYESLKVVFQGEGADFYADEIKPKTDYNTYPQCGSDEVGTGDYFGPMVVCACRIEKTNLAQLKALKIQDSKQIKDEDIIEIAPILMQHIPYSILILENAKYNQVHQSDNMNAIKAKMHNQAFIHLETKTNTPLENVIVDQFTPEKSYYRYLQGVPKIIKSIHFETKAENKYLSVACASIIARYHFLKALALLSEKYDFSFPKGAGTNVDKAGVEFVKKYDFALLKQVSKFHFKNTEKIQAKIQDES